MATCRKKQKAKWKLPQERKDQHTHTKQQQKERPNERWNEHTKQIKTSPKQKRKGTRHTAKEGKKGKRTHGKEGQTSTRHKRITDARKQHINIDKTRRAEPHNE